MSNYEQLSISDKIFKPVIKFQQHAITQFERRFYFPKEAERLRELFPQAESLLDLGSGLGYLGDELVKLMPHATIVSSDMEKRDSNDSPFIISDMNNLPFGDDTFNLVTAFYSLHHTSTPQTALHEIARVSKDFVVIQEDVYSNPLQQSFYQFHLSSYQLAAASDGLKPRTEFEWKEMFDQAGFEIILNRKIHKIVGYPVGRREYILKPH